MDKLSKALNNWIQHGFINQEQADQIRQYEAQKSESSWILSGILILGICVIAIGIISFLAANWQNISDSIKIFADFGILIFVALCLVRARVLNKDMQFEMLLLFFILLCLASIGLISQVYNTGGELYQALMLWSLITVPPMLLARYAFVPFIWMGAFLGGLTYTALESPLFYPLFHQNLSAIMVIPPLLSACFAFGAQFLNADKRFVRAFQLWIFISGMVSIMFVEIAGSPLSPYVEFMPFFSGFILAFLLLLFFLREPNYNQSQKILLLLTLVAYMLLMHLPLLNAESSVFYAVLTIIILGLIAILMASMKFRAVFQWFVFFIGIRFLILYFQALGGLAYTGIGLIISGAIIIFLVILWNKYRKRLSLWAERWIA